MVSGRHDEEIAQPVTTANARTGRAILDGAFPIDGAISFQKMACAVVRAWLTSDVGQNTVSPQSKDYLEIHQLISEELRHTATVFWRFSVAIVTLQATAIGFSVQKGAFDLPIGKAVLLVAFSLSFCFSVMLYRQAKDRSGFVERIKYVEEELRADYPRIFFKIESPPLWFKSHFLAQILVFESGIGAIWFAYTLFSKG